MPIDEKLDNKKEGNGLLKAVGGLGLLLHSAFHLLPLVGAGYLAFGGDGGILHSHAEESGIGHYLLDFLGLGFGIWGIYYAYQGIKEYFMHRKRGHYGYRTEYTH